MMQIYVSKCEAGPTFPSEVEAYGSEKGQLTVDDITNVLKKLGRKMRKDRCLIGGLEHFLFFHILGIIIPTD